ncbi:hypothetical protein QBC38DRAFT_443491 [Podospora fimiseda]|uniref:Ecp2 effector protein domain-containing protein n=1 Tax=Podospora fimiseda TaxID=252190 RepID=A0AAN7BQN4_9PEZI|nr:hypothetical protein QBC38DRAFT_443491 [Podospora fimiseda]
MVPRFFLVLLCRLWGSFSLTGYRSVEGPQSKQKEELVDIEDMRMMAEESKLWAGYWGTGAEITFTQKTGQAERDHARAAYGTCTMYAKEPVLYIPARDQGGLLGPDWGTRWEPCGVGENGREQARGWKRGGLFGQDTGLLFDKRDLRGEKSIVLILGTAFWRGLVK